LVSNTQMPKVSVIVPNYNHGCFLKKRLDSIFNQTFQDFEIIFLDDASTDNSMEVFAQYASNPKIKKVLVNKRNSGSVFKQWNKGVRQARGEYIWIAESDDYADPGFLGKLVPLLDNNKRVGLACCAFHIVDSNDNITGSFADYDIPRLRQDRWKADFINDGRDECKRFLLFGNTIPNVSGVLLRRSLYDKVGGANERLRLSGDWDLYVKILLSSDIAFLAQPFNYCRVHEESMRSRTADTYIYEKFKVAQSVIKKAGIPENGILEASMQQILRLITSSEHSAVPQHYLSVSGKLILVNWKHRIGVRLYIEAVTYFLQYIRFKVALRTRVKRCVGKLKLLHNTRDNKT